MSDKLLEEANRAAHRVARLLGEERETSRREAAARNDCRNTAGWTWEKQRAGAEVQRALDAYQEIQSCQAELGNLEATR